MTITRTRHGKGFTYHENGTAVKDKAKLDYYASLKIPPAWQHVEISRSKSAKVQATGKDKAGRLQYIYNAKYRAKQEEAKFERILKFADALPKMRRTTNQHLQHQKLDREKVLACIVQLMDTAYFRVGNDTYAQENKTYGITTLRSKHTDIKRDEVVFDFTGKSGQHHHKTITDKKLVKIVRQLDNLPGYEIFKYVDEDGKLHQVKSKDVNQYIKEIMGDEFTAKDFRTWGGTVIASTELAQCTLENDTKNGRKKAVTVCVKKVAKRLGNTPAIARGSYIDPRIINNFTNNFDYEKIRRTLEKERRKSYLNPDEQFLLKQLEKTI